MIVVHAVTSEAVGANTDRSPSHWFTTQMKPAWATLKPAARTPSSSPMWVSGTQLLEPLLLSPGGGGCTGKKLELEVESWNPNPGPLPQCGHANCHSTRVAQLLGHTHTHSFLILYLHGHRLLPTLPQTGFLKMDAASTDAFVSMTGS